jgi:hypothetical protein
MQNVAVEVESFSVPRSVASDGTGAVALLIERSANVLRRDSLTGITADGVGQAKLLNQRCAVTVAMFGGDERYRVRVGFVSVSAWTVVERISAAKAIRKMVRSVMVASCGAPCLLWC